MAYPQDSLSHSKSLLLLASQHIDSLSSFLPPTSFSSPLSQSSTSSSSSPSSLAMSLSQEKEKEWREKLQEALKAVGQVTEMLTCLANIQIHPPPNREYIPREYTLDEISKIVTIQCLFRSWLARRMKRKIQVERELLETESKYVKDLGILFSHYLSPLQTLSLLSKEQEESIFGLPILFDIHSSHSFFLTLMQKSFENGICLGDLFLDGADFLRDYHLYVTNFDHALESLTEAIQNQQINQFLNTQRGVKECENRDIQAFLILPIQRIPRYLMLLQQILKYSNGRERPNLSLAVSKVESICSEINLQKKKVDNALRITHLQGLISNRKAVNLSSDWIIKEGFLQVSASEHDIPRDSAASTQTVKWTKWLSNGSDTNSPSSPHHKRHDPDDRGTRKIQLQNVNITSNSSLLYVIATKAFLFFFEASQTTCAVVTEGKLKMKMKMRMCDIHDVKLVDGKVEIVFEGIRFSLCGINATESRLWMTSIQSAEGIQDLVVAEEKRKKLSLYVGTAFGLSSDRKSPRKERFSDRSVSPNLANLNEAARNLDAKINANTTPTASRRPHQIRNTSPSPFRLEKSNLSSNVKSQNVTEIGNDSPQVTLCDTPNGVLSVTLSPPNTSVASPDIPILTFSSFEKDTVKARRPQSLSFHSSPLSSLPPPLPAPNDSHLTTLPSHPPLPRPLSPSAPPSVSPLSPSPLSPSPPLSRRPHSPAPPPLSPLPPPSPSHTNTPHSPLPPPLLPLSSPSTPLPPPPLSPLPPPILSPPSLPLPPPLSSSLPLPPLLPIPPPVSQLPPPLLE